MNKNLLAACALALAITAPLAAQGITASIHPFVNVRNSTGETAEALYCTDSDNSDWGKNRLEKPLKNNMPVQYTLEKTLGEARVYDFALKDTKGNMYAKYNVDVRSLNVLVFTKSDLEKPKTQEAAAGGGAGNAPASGASTSAKDTLENILSAVSSGVTANTSTSERLVREALVAAAMMYIGARYKLGSQSPPSSFDCSGLVSQAYRDVTGMVIPRTSKEMFKQGISISAAQAKPGDVIVMNTDTPLGNTPTHVALYVDDKTTVQALDGIKPPSVARRENPGISQCKVLGYRTFIGWKPGNKQNYQPVGSTDFNIVVTDKARLQGVASDVNTIEPFTTVRFVVTNNSGKSGSFDYKFYRVGAPANETDSEHFNLDNGKRFESALCLPKTAGAYKLELFNGGKRVLEHEWEAGK